MTVNEAGLLLLAPDVWQGEPGRAIGARVESLDADGSIRLTDETGEFYVWTEAVPPPDVTAGLRTFEIRICDDCYVLKGEMCHNAECVFCRRTMAEVGELLDTLLIRPIVDGERFDLHPFAVLQSPADPSATAPTLKIALAELAGYGDGFRGMVQRPADWFDTADENMAYTLWYGKAMKERVVLCDAVAAVERRLKEAEAENARLKAAPSAVTAGLRERLLLQDCFVLMEGLRIGVEWELAPPIKKHIAELSERLAAALRPAPPVLSEKEKDDAGLPR